MTETDWKALRASLAGDVLTPESPEYDAARRPAIANFQNVRPSAVVRCRGAADVAETVAFAAAAGVRLAPRSGGHCFGGRSSTTGIVLDVGPMRSVSVADGIATVGAGTRLGALYDALTERGVTIPAGCGPTVGIGGLTLGGGIGVLGRQYGLTSDRLVGAEVVLADGRVVRCDAEREPELFWALRGAGGCRFGVVTELELATVPTAPTTIFHLTWPMAAAVKVVDTWQHWAPGAPDELAASLLVRASRETPPTIHVFGAMSGYRSDLTPLLDQLIVRTGTGPDTLRVDEASHRESKRRLAESFPPDDSADLLYSKSEFFERTLPTDAIEALMAWLNRDRPHIDYTRTLDFMPWAGAYNRPSPDATAFPHRQARFLLKHEVSVPWRGQEAWARSWLQDSWNVVHPWGTGGVYVNFPDPDLVTWSTAYHGANRDRLLNARFRYNAAGIVGV